LWCSQCLLFIVSSSGYSPMYLQQHWQWSLPVDHKRFQDFIILPVDFLQSLDQWQHADFFIWTRIIVNWLWRRKAADSSEILVYFYSSI
jgi:hypothetical protein